MAGRFSYSRGTGLQDPWFRIGSVEIGSAALLALVCGVVLVVGAFVPQFLAWLALWPGAVWSGEVWRIVTWPLASLVNPWSVFSIAIVGWVGTRIEVATGRARMAFLLGLLIFGVGLFATAIGVDLAGVRQLAFVLVLLSIADYPKASFFGIPVWVLGAAFVAISILQYVQQRLEGELLVFLFALVLGAITARSVGLLSQYDFIPRIPLPSSLSGTPRRTTRKSGNAPLRNHRGKVVDGPWAQSAPPADTAASQAELDLLLDKISESGLDSLSKQERQRLNELSKKLR